YTNFTSFRLSCGLRRSKNRETAGIFGTGCVIVIPSHATLLQLPSGQGFAPTPQKSVPLCATLSAEKIFKGDFVSY
ncbi:hypothetical protein, partial [Escherichia coli]|uniref:hypothetical protein n=1 Tax=Escherichia coli TaxID=562 RepID=UPI001E4CDB2B